jgi:hypothetical protein
VLQNFPYAYCFPCLASHASLTESEVRGAAQVLVIKDAFRVVRRVCYRCSHTDDMLVPDKTLPE